MLEGKRERNRKCSKLTLKKTEYSGKFKYKLFLIKKMKVANFNESLHQLLSYSS